MFHTIIISGYLGRKPELNYTQSGKAVANLSVATSRTWTDGKGHKVSETLWFRVTVWDKMAETCARFLDKGSAVLVEGRLTGDENGNPRTFERKDGSTGSSFEITANTVKFIGGKKPTTNEEGWDESDELEAWGSVGNGDDDSGDDDDDYPF